MALIDRGGSRRDAEQQSTVVSEERVVPEEVNFIAVLEVKFLSELRNSFFETEPL